jgi:DNA-binding response OmpR family regulator
MGRVRAILRRSGTSVADNTQLMTIGSLQIDGQRCEALLDGQPVSLAAQEWALLWFFAQNRGLALTRRQLLDGGWGSDWVGDIRTVDVHVRQLRRKLDDALPVKTVRGIGYRFD